MVQGHNVHDYIRSVLVHHDRNYSQLDGLTPNDARSLIDEVWAVGIDDIVRRDSGCG